MQTKTFADQTLILELGRASVETKGPKGDFPDVGDGRILAGLTDE